jgi:hypothetical protein
MKKIDDVSDLVSQAIESNQITKENRFKELGPDVERVGDVIDIFLSQLCDALSVHKFKYSKNKKQLYKTVNGFRFEITCRSDSSNLSGIYVGISFMISVSNTRYKKWYSAIFPFRADGCLVACDLGKLSNISNLCKWDISDSNTRPEIFYEILTLINGHVITFFENFSCEDVYRKYIRGSNFRIVFRHYAVIHAVWLNDSPLACTHIDEILQDTGNTLEELKAQRQMFVNEGCPKYLDAGDEVGYWAKTSIQLRLFE